MKKEAILAYRRSAEREKIEKYEEEEKHQKM